MKEKESFMVVLCELKLPMHGNSASIGKPATGYPRNGIFNPHFTIKKNVYCILIPVCQAILVFAMFSLFVFNLAETHLGV